MSNKGYDDTTIITVMVVVVAMGTLYGFTLMDTFNKVAAVVGMLGFYISFKKDKKK